MGLKIPVIYQSYGEEKYTERLDKPIKNSNTAKQCLRKEDEGITTVVETGQRKRRCINEPDQDGHQATSTKLTDSKISIRK